MKKTNGLRRMRQTAMAACLSAAMLTGPIGSALAVTRGLNSLVVRAEEGEAGKQNHTLQILQPGMLDGDYGNRLTIPLAGTPNQYGSFYDYFSNIARLTVDDKDFGFTKSLYNGYWLKDNQIIVMNDAVKQYFESHQQHKIEITFRDGSKTIYQDKDYVKPENADAEDSGVLTDNSSFAGKQMILEATNKNAYSTDPELTITLQAAYKNDEVLEQLVAVRLNGKDYPKSSFSTKYGNAIRAYSDQPVTQAWVEKGPNRIELVFANAVVSSAFTAGASDAPAGDNGQSGETEQPGGSGQSADTLVGKAVIKKAGLTSYADALEFTLADGLSAKAVYAQLTGVRINGKEFPKEKFRAYYGDKDIRTEYSDVEDVVAAWKIGADNEVSFLFAEGESLRYSQGGHHTDQTDANDQSAKPKTMVPVSKQMKDGTYTLGFDALYADGREGSSMLAGFFDKHIKLEVSQGKMKITMLNTLFAHGLLEMAVQNKGEWKAMQKENYGEPNSAGHFDRALFSMEIDDLDQLHMAGVLVSYMGGLETDKGNYDRYTKVKLKFDAEAAEGFEDFHIVEVEKKERAASSALLQKKLCAQATDSEGNAVNNVDADGDGKVTADELFNFKGIIDIGDLEIDGAVDKGAIYDIELLKNMGPGVTEFRSSSNVLGELPEDLFAKAVNIRRIRLGGNKITRVPSKLFAHNTKLEDVNLSANALGELPADLFANNSALRMVQIDNAWLTTVSAQQFAHNPRLEQVGLNDNKLSALPEELFANNPNLNFVGLRDNELTALPASMGSLGYLRTLDFSNNKVKELPAGFSGLTSLKKLNAKNNELTKIADEVWAILAKNKGRVTLVCNHFSEIPVEVIKANGSLEALDLASNNLPVDMPYTEADAAILGVSPKSIHGYYPQKTAVQFKATAKDGVISFAPEGDLTILNLLHWITGRSTFYGGEGILQGAAKYREFIQTKSQPLHEMLCGTDYGMNWEIVTRIERIRGGKSTEISATTVKNANDEAGQINDPAMEAGDVYRITKELYRKIVTGDTEKLFVIPFEVKAEVAEVSQSDIKAYRVPISLRQAASGEQSMGNGALVQEAYAEVNEKTGKTAITMTFKPMYLEQFKATGHLTKLGAYPSLEDMTADKNLVMAEVLTTYTDESGQITPRKSVPPTAGTVSVAAQNTTLYLAGEQAFPQQVRIVRAVKNEPEIGIKVWVDMMDELAKLSGKSEGPQPAVLKVDWAKAEEVTKREQPAPAPDADQQSDQGGSSADRTAEDTKPSAQTKIHVDQNGIKHYQLPVSLINSTTGGASMGAKALDELAAIEEKPDGEIRVTLTFKPLYLAAFKATGHLTRLGIYPSLEDMKAKTNMKDAEVVETYEENGVKYPKKVRYTLAKKGTKDTGARVWVDMMDEIAKQGGQQDGSQAVIIRLDWSGLGVDGSHRNGTGIKNPTTGEAKLTAPIAGFIISAAAAAAAICLRRKKKTEDRPVLR